MTRDADVTAWGTPVKHMWFCPDHDWGKPALGLSAIKGVAHAPIFEPEHDEGAYNHHPEITWHHGVFHAMWSNNLIGEDRAGQRILYSATENPSEWPPARPLFPQPGPFFDHHTEAGKASKEPGFYMTAMKFIPLGGALYAVAALDAADGRITPLVRKVQNDGELGEIFAIQPGIRSPHLEALTFPVIDPVNEPMRNVAEKLLMLYQTPAYLPSWNFGIETLFPRPKMVEGYAMCEWSIHTATDGKYVMLARDRRHSHRMYCGVSASPDPNSFSPLHPTDIPDTPSKAVTVTLDSGHVLLIGNQQAKEFDRLEKPNHYERDPLTISISPDGYRFEKQLVLRWEGGRRWRTECRRVSGRGAGCQYPSALLRDGKLYVIYSIGKEDIAVSWFDLGRLPL